jgi:hypothetical protein
MKKQDKRDYLGIIEYLGIAFYVLSLFLIVAAGVIYVQ